MRPSGGLSSRRTAIASPAPNRCRLESRSASRRARPRPPTPGERGGAPSCGQARRALVVLLWAALTISLALTALAGCGRDARAQPATPPPQPTPDKTVDAVVRGLVTIAVPTVTRAPAPTTAPQRIEPVRPIQAAASAAPVTRAPSPPAITSTAVDRPTATTGSAQAEPTVQPRRPSEAGDFAAPAATAAALGATRAAQPSAPSATAKPPVEPAAARSGPAGAGP